MRSTTKVLPITEAHVQQTVVQFLELDGWRAIRTDPVSDRGRGKGFGEVGMPDYLFIRYLGHAEPAQNIARRWAEVLWLEFKRGGKIPRLTQITWHVSERMRGALVMVVDDIDEFAKWYQASELCTRIVK